MKPKRKPQQIRRPAGPGTLLKRLFGLHEQTRKRAVMGDDQIYLARIRQLPCLDCGVDGFTEAAHVRMQSGAFNKHGGMGKKPEDRWALPLCSPTEKNGGAGLHGARSSARRSRRWRLGHCSTHGTRFS